MTCLEVVAENITLQEARRGEVFYGLCPFHEEKTPSFLVTQNRFHCLGCGVEGDVDEFRRLLAEKAARSMPAVFVSYTCPQCNMTSYHPEDARNRYCGYCHEFEAYRGR